MTNQKDKMKVGNKLMMDHHIMATGPEFVRELKHRSLWATVPLLIVLAGVYIRQSLNSTWDDREYRAARLLEEIHAREGAYNREVAARRRQTQDVKPKTS